MPVSAFLKGPEPDPRAQRAAELESLCERLRTARGAGNDIEADLLRSAINNILDHWSDET